ncbi:hypothetical protein OHS71_40345 [Streptomyces sp. NBC_00377]|uniref:hypothetical protein n=1 Tax=unclassified Streptomyces TaxID=2593676 RepID=UPI002E21C25C|nr:MULTISPECIES: hypothetical protein [unclassified Streptomyces]
MMPPVAHHISIGRPGEEELSGCTRHAAPSGWCCTAGGLDLPEDINAREATLFLCFLCGFSRSATAGRCAAGSM